MYKHQPFATDSVALWYLKAHGLFRATLQTAYEGRPIPGETVSCARTARAFWMRSWHNWDREYHSLHACIESLPPDALVQHAQLMAQLLVRHDANLRSSLKRAVRFHAYILNCGESDEGEPEYRASHCPGAFHEAFANLFAICTPHSLRRDV